jgi:hypothetical protein
VVAAGQERCFACGQKVKVVRRGRQAPLNWPLIIIAGLALLVAVVGTVLVLVGRPKQQAKQAAADELIRIQDSVRAANRARRDTARVQRRDAAADRLTRELDEIDDRFASVKKQVVVGSPTAEQAKLINEIQARLGQLHSAAQGAALKPEGVERSQAEDAVRAGLREVRTAVSKLTRAPKNKPAPAKTP